MLCMKVVKRVNPEFSSQGILVYFSFALYQQEMMNYCGHHFMMYINQSTMLSIGLKLNTMLCMSVISQ